MATISTANQPCCTGITHTLASYHTIALSNLISLTPAAYYRLAQLRATSHQQVTKQAVQFDYRQHNQHLAIHLHNKTLIETYIALFAKINLTITAIDIPACALRYVATHLNISPHSILIFCQNNQMLWVCADKRCPITVLFLIKTTKSKKNNYSNYSSSIIGHRSNVISQVTMQNTFANKCLFGQPKKSGYLCLYRPKDATSNCHWFSFASLGDSMYQINFLPWRQALYRHQAQRWLY
ncbi:hypothetical protein ACU42Y_01490 [Proteus mirabilis]